MRTAFKYKKDWGVKKISHAFKIIGSGTTPTTENRDYYENGTISWVLTGDLNDHIIHSTTKKITIKAISDFSVLRIYPKGTLIIALYGATIGKLGILGIEACTNQACCCIYNSNDFLIKYVFYWFLSNRKQIVNMANGGGQPNISQEIIRSIKLPCPPIHEQKTIVKFLDAQSQLIEQIILSKEKKIRLLQEKRTAIINQAVTKGLDPDAPMKDSGIEWLGEVPEHWEVSRIKYISKIVNGATPKSTKDGFWDGDISWITPDDLGQLNSKFIKRSRRTISKMGLESCGTTLTPLGSIIMSTRAPIGHLGITSIETCTNQGCKTFVPDENRIQNHYLYYVLLTVKSELQSYGQGSTFIELQKHKLGAFKLPVPPLEDQKKIIDYISSKVTQIDLTINNEIKQINFLEEYKTTLISETITGKNQSYIS